MIPIFGSFLFCLAAQAYAQSATVPELGVRVGREIASKVPRWLVELKPPKGHHFNLSAPMKVEAGSVIFKSVLKQEHRLGFAATSDELSGRTILEASAFLCDDAKTYCLKKEFKGEMKIDPSLQTLEKSINSSGPRDKSGLKSKETWMQDPELALERSRKSGKPILIDFYGIWCPPCNLYDETVFSRPAFKRFSEKVILLKLDADKETSFPLKSKFRVGGYPTLILAKTEDNGGMLVPLEIGRVVGYFPEADFLARLEGLLRAGAPVLEKRISSLTQELLGVLREKTLKEIESQNAGGALNSANQALTLAPSNLEFSLLKIRARALDQTSFKWEPGDSRVILDSLAGPDHKETTLLFLALEILNEFKSQVKEVQDFEVRAVFSELRKRLDPMSARLPGVECSSADLDVLESDVATVFGDEKWQKEARKRAISNSLKIMEVQKLGDSRALNLELAGLYVQDSQFGPALDIYQRFIKKFPKEFTFHYGAARVYLEQNDLKSARNEAEEAVRYAYGDHLIRSMDRLLKIMKAQGEGAFALRRGEDFVKELKLDPSFKVRTERYLAALNRTLDEIRKENPKP